MQFTFKTNLNNYVLKNQKGNITISDVGTPLADHLNYSINNDTAYNKHHPWRNYFRVFEKNHLMVCEEAHEIKEKKGLFTIRIEDY